MDEINGIIRILNELCPYEEIDSSSELINSRILTSLSIINLIIMIEEEFDCTIPDECISAENFATVTSINNLINQYKNGRAT